jgi:hypothetical protein
MILGGLAAAVRFLPRAWRATWLVLILAIVMTALALLSGQLAAWVVALAMNLIARAGLWRQAGEAGLAPGGSPLGSLELRLAAVWGLSAVFLAVIALLILIILLCGAYAAASAGPGFQPANIATWTPAITGSRSAFLGAIAAACAVGFLYVATRISLAEAATVGQGGVQVLSSFTLTRGRTFPLVLAYAVIALPALAAIVWETKSGWTVGSAALGALAIDALWLPMSVGLMAYAYRTGAAGT